MDIMLYVNFKWFIISLAFGLFILYCTSPKPEVIIKYPTPQNASKLVFKDDTDNCYTFITKTVECPSDSKKIHDIPIQHSVEHFKQKKND